MQARITKFLGFQPHWETDHTQLDMKQIIGAACYEVEHADGAIEELCTGLRPEENNAWSRKVIEAAQVWRNEGGVIPEWVPPNADKIRAESKPLTARQFRLGLLEAGRTFKQVEAAISAIKDETERSKALVEWEYAAEFNRIHPLVISLASALDFTPEQLDTLWQDALRL